MSSTTSTYLAEEALALPATQRAALVGLLLESLRGDPRSDAQIAADLQARLDALLSGADAGVTFEDVFGEKA